MTQISDRSILFADLRGSTGLFETLGNAEATSVVTHCVSALGPPVEQHGGHVVEAAQLKYAGIIRTEAGLLEAKKQLTKVNNDLTARATFSRAYFETMNILLVAGLIISHALKRKDSIGTHYMLR